MERNRWSQGCSVYKQHSVLLHCYINIKNVKCTDGKGNILNSFTSYITVFYIVQEAQGTAILEMEICRESSTFLGGSVDGSMSESTPVVGGKLFSVHQKRKALKAVRQHGVSCMGQETWSLFLALLLNKFIWINGDQPLNFCVSYFPELEIRGNTLPLSISLTRTLWD